MFTEFHLIVTEHLAFVIGRSPDNAGTISRLKNLRLESTESIHLYTSELSQLTTGTSSTRGPATFTRCPGLFPLGRDGD